MFSSDLEYTSQPYTESMAMRLAVQYIPYAIYSKEKTVHVITFTQFEDGNLLLESCNRTERGDKPEDNLTFPPLISEAKIYEMSSGDESDAEPMSTDMLEDICDGIQSHMSINRRQARYKMHGHNKEMKAERKGALLSTQNMGKRSHKAFEAVVNDISEPLPIMRESVP